MYLSGSAAYLHFRKKRALEAELKGPRLLAVGTYPIPSFLCFSTTTFNMTVCLLQLKSMSPIFRVGWALVIRTAYRRARFRGTLIWHLKYCITNWRSVMDFRTPPCGKRLTMYLAVS